MVRRAILPHYGTPSIEEKKLNIFVLRLYHLIDRTSKLISIVKNNDEKLNQKKIRTALLTIKWYKLIYWSSPNMHLIDCRTIKTYTTILNLKLY